MRAILTGVGRVLVNRRPTRFSDAQHSPRNPNIGDHKRDLFGGPHSREEPELIIVALRLAPIAMDRGDERLRLLDIEWIDFCPIFLQYAGALEPKSRVVLFRVMALAKLERPSHHAYR